MLQVYVSCAHAYKLHTHMKTERLVSGAGEWLPNSSVLGVGEAGQRIACGSSFNHRAVTPGWVRSSSHLHNHLTGRSSGVAVLHAHDSSMATQASLHHTRAPLQIRELESSRLNLPAPEMMTTRRTAAASTAGSPQAAGAASAPAPLLPAVHRCVEHQWAAAHLKMIQEESKERAAAAAAATAAAKRERAAELAANPPPPAEVAAVAAAEAVATPMPKRLKPNVVVLPPALGAVWEPGQPVPTAAQIAAARQPAYSYSNITRRLSACGQDPSEVTAHTGASAWTSAPVATGAHDHLVMHDHDAAATPSPPCGSDVGVAVDPDAAMHDDVATHGVHDDHASRVAQAMQLAQLFGALADTSGSRIQTAAHPHMHGASGLAQSLTGRTPVTTGATHYDVPASVAPQAQGSAVGTLQTLQRMALIQAQSSTQCNGKQKMQEWLRRGALGTGAVGSCREQLTTSGVPTPDMSADVSAGSAVSGATRCGPRRAAPGCLAHHQLSMHQQHGSGVPQDQNTCMQMHMLTDSAQMHELERFNPRKRPMVDSLDGCSSPEQKRHAQQDFGLRGSVDAPPKRAPREPCVTVVPTRLRYKFMCTGRRAKFSSACAEVARQKVEEEQARCEARSNACEAGTHSMCSDGASDNSGSDTSSVAASSVSANDSEYDSLTSEEEDDEWDVAEVLEGSNELETMRWVERQGGKDRDRGVVEKSDSWAQREDHNGWGAVAPQEVVPEVTEGQSAKVCLFYVLSVFCPEAFLAE